MANGEIAAYNAVSVAERLSSKLRTEIFDLIPEEQLQAMIRNVFEGFMKPATRDRHGNWVHDKDTLVTIIRDIIHSHLAEVVKTELAKPEWDIMYENAGTQVVSETLKIMIKDNAQAMFNDMVQGMVAMQVERLKASLGRSAY